jgi:hypothetical protein
MAIFTGKIIEAYFANSENDAVEVIYNDGNKAINHYLRVDFNDQDFKDLISEYSTDKISEATAARNRNYAKQLSDLVDAGIKSRSDLKQKISVEDFVKKILDFDPDDRECREIFFTMKVQIFETKKLKDSDDADYKARLRSAQNPIDLLAAYNGSDD